MEMLSVNRGAGQGYGFVMYRTTAPKEAKQLGVRGLKDFGVVSSWAGVFKAVWIAPPPHPQRDFLHNAP